MHTTYDPAGRVGTSQLDNLAPFLYLYDSTHGMLDQLKYPNTLVKKHNYHAQLYLIIGLDYQAPINESCPERHEYVYDSSSRPTQKRYLQISCTALSHREYPALWHITCNPTEPIAMPPLATQKNPTHIKSLLYHIPGTEDFDKKREGRAMSTWAHIYPWTKTYCCEK